MLKISNTLSELLNEPKSKNVRSKPRKGTKSGLAVKIVIKVHNNSKTNTVMYVLSEII